MENHLCLRNDVITQLIGKNSQVSLERWLSLLFSENSNGNAATVSELYALYKPVTLLGTSIQSVVNTNSQSQGSSSGCLGA